MINVIGSVPKDVYIAVSGGVDSMAALDFISRGNRSVTALYFNHGTEFSAKAEAFVEDYCEQKNISLHKGFLSRSKLKSESQEEFWRNERYRFFSDFCDKKILTCHHLDDTVETWLFTSLHGNPNIIPYSRDNFLRPFLTTRKKDFYDWCNRKSVPYLEDPSNEEQKYMRNYIRHTLLGNALKVNPGIHKVIKKKVISMFRNTVDNI
tara:strand:- start:78 stop:698 length:621 start_codon:yes stop_codon:yes gene_type:complete